MSDLLEYLGYKGTVEYSADDSLLFGKILFIDSLLMYHGQSASEIKSAFISTVDAYLELCRKNKREPNKPYKGSFNVRLTPELHKAAVELAAQRAITLNDFVFRTISNEVTEANEKQNTIHAWAQITTATGSSQTSISSNITQPDQQNMYGSQVANYH